MVDHEQTPAYARGQSFTGEDAIIPGIFWLSNVHEMLSFICVAESDMLQGIGPGEENAVRPFEDASSLEFWAQKNDASIFVVGQSTKKRPHGMTFVRTFDYRVLDMCEVGVDDWKSMADFKVRRRIQFS